MPNWCFSQLRITSEDTAKLKTIYKTIETAINNPPIEKSDFGSAWLGNILAHFNINWRDGSPLNTKTSTEPNPTPDKETLWTNDPDYNRNQNTSISCRGSVCTVEFNKNCNAIDLWTETAWDSTPAISTIETIIKHENIDAKLLWYGDEEGCEYYLTNDPTFGICDGQYHLVFIFNGKDFEGGYNNIEDALLKASELAHKPLTSLDELEQFSDDAYDIDEDSEIKIIEFEYINEY